MGDRNILTAEGAASPNVVVQDVWFAPRGGEWVLQGISLEVPAGACLALVGPSGAGKTTLLRLLAGFIQPQRGSVTVLGRPLAGGVPPSLRRQIGYIPQQLGLVRGLTVLENTLLGGLGRCGFLGPLLGYFPKILIDQAHRFLAELGLAHKAREPVMRLSGGQRQRVAIARTLMQEPKLILADEFVSDLDLVTATQVLQMIRRVVVEKGITVIMSMHDLSLIRLCADRVAVLKGRRLVYEGGVVRVTDEHLREMLLA